MDEATDGSDVNPGGEGVNDLTPVCDRCRRRKIKCSRGHPCRQCITGEASCTYDIGFRPRVQRQRVRVSNDFEIHVKRIAKGVDELKSMMQGIVLQHPEKSPSHVSPVAIRTSTNPEISSAASSSRPSPASAQTPGVNSGSSLAAPQTEYSGESSVFAHALFATAFLQNAVGNSASFQVTVEMAPVIQTLSSIAEAQKHTADSQDILFPHARPLDDGRKPQDYPRPAPDKVFGCLRMAQEHDGVEALWFHEFESLSHFTEHVIKVCSPGQSSEADLIIFNVGMYWLFLECASCLNDEAMIADYAAQADLCRDNVETLLLHLGFHVPNTLDYAYAMNMAATYCLQTIKTSTAWGFMTTASHICHALGLQSAVSLHPESSRQKSRKSRLFWAVYGTEKSLALRLGRSSTFRDSDITIPRPETPSGPDTLINKFVPLWAQTGHLQGRVYDEIYSPGAFLQPEEVRYARSRALIADINSLIEAEEVLQKEIDSLYRIGSQTGSQILSSQLSWRADRITSLSMLTLIYRSLPSAEPFNSSFNIDCITTARQALEEHEVCLTALGQTSKELRYIDLFIDWSLIQSPFVPYTIIFCHVIESSSKTDLHVLKRFLDSLKGTTYATRYTSTQNQLRLFQALYSVAVQYISVKESSLLQEDTWPPGGGPSTSSITAGQASQGQTNTSSPFLEPRMEYIPTPSNNSAQGSGFATAQAGPQPAEDQFLTNLGLQVDSSGGALANWFASNQQLMSMLEKT